MASAALTRGIRNVRALKKLLEEHPAPWQVEEDRRWKLKRGEKPDVRTLDARGVEVEINPHDQTDYALAITAAVNLAADIVRSR
jgi:hypothetical protein